MANVVTLRSFPFDWQEVLNPESGQMEADREYDAEQYRRYFAKFLSNGVYFGQYKGYGENSMKVTADGGLNIRVAKGAGIIEGADFESENEQVFTLERPASGERVDKVIVRLDKTLATRETQLYIKEGNGATPAELQRDENIYEICLAEVTVKSATNLTEADIKDTRLDKNLCGIVNSLISVDGEELYKRFKEYIDSALDNLAKLDANNMFTGTSTFVQEINGWAKFASSASKLREARAINLSGAAVGNASFDGSKDVEIVLMQNMFSTVTDIVEITANASQIATGKITVSYPNGFNKSNCHVLTIASQEWQQGDFNYGYGQTSADYIRGSIFRNAKLMDNGIEVSFSYDQGSTGTISRKYMFTLVLLKIS